MFIKWAKTQQRANESKRGDLGVLPLGLSYSEVTEDEPTLQGRSERKKGHGQRGPEEKIHLLMTHSTSGKLTLHSSPSPLRASPPAFGSLPFSRYPRNE